MKQTKLYPPGGGEPVNAHPSMVETMKANGWTEKPAKVKPQQTKEDE